MTLTGLTMDLGIVVATLISRFDSLLLNFNESRETRSPSNGGSGKTPYQLAWKWDSFVVASVTEKPETTNISNMTYEKNDQRQNFCEFCGSSSSNLQSPANIGRNVCPSEWVNGWFTAFQQQRSLAPTLGEGSFRSYPGRTRTSWQT